MKNTLLGIAGLSWLAVSNNGFAAAVIEEVIVTAQKREQSLQDVPVTVQSFTGDELARYGVSQVTDVVKLAPNLNVVVQNAMSQHIVIRGVGTNEFFGNAPSSVGTYMDEVTMNSSYMSTLGLFDIERVEILRGPQNSLFGRNTTGGAINYISVLPVVGEELTGNVSATYGRHDLVDLTGGVSVPIGDRAALRLAANVRRQDGRWENVDSGDNAYGEVDRKSIRATLVFAPTDNSELTLSYHTAKDDSEAQPQKAFGTLDPNNPPLRLIPDEQTIAGGFTRDIDFDELVPYVTSQNLFVATTDWDEVRTGGSQKADLDVDGGYIKYFHEFATVNLTAIYSFDETRGLYEEDNGVSGNNLGGVNSEALVIDMDQEYDQKSFEIRLASNDDAASFRWIVGAYYFDEESTLAQDIRFGTGGVLAFHPVVNGVPPSVLCPADPNCTDDVAGFFYALDLIPNPYANTASFSVAELEDESVSIYGHTEWDLTNAMTLTVGLRYTEDTKSNPRYTAGAFDITGNSPATYYGRARLQQETAGLPACVPGPPFFTGNCSSTNTARADIESEETGGKIGLDYRISDAVMVYGSYSRGFKSGKFDVEFLHTDDTPFPQRSLDVEVLDVFELGFKSELVDGRLLLNGAVFHNTWKDQQVFNVGSNGPEFFNLPESEITGLELEMKWLPAATWLIGASVGLLDSEITDASGIDFDLGQGEFQEGHELPLAPETTANLSVIKDVPFGSSMLTLQLDGRYQSSSKAKFKPSIPIDEYQSRFEVNARASYVFGDALQYELGLYLENLTEEQYCLEKQDLHALVGAYYCVPNDGERRYGLEAKLHF
jgi:iron complex outermembrane receptor protein